MDFLGPINLIVVTIIYSGFVAPGLNKLSKIRDSIGEIKFLLLNDPEEIPDDLREKGEELEQKLMLYRLKYRDVANLLKFFHAVIILMLYAQIGVAYKQALLDHNPSPNLALTLLLIAIILWLLNKAINAYMIPREKVHSINWLTKNAGLRPVYYQKLIGLSLYSKKIIDSSLDGLMKIEYSLRMKQLFLGYRFILTLESGDHRKLYYVSMGPIGAKGTTPFQYYPSNGDTFYEINIGSMNVKPGSYIARLLIFDAPLRSEGRKPVEYVYRFRINKELTPAVLNHGIQIKNENRAKYITYEGEGLDIKAVSCSVDGLAEDNVVRLLNAGRLNRLFMRTSRIVELKEINGELDRLALLSRSGMRSMLVRRIKRLTLRQKNLSL